MTQLTSEARPLDAPAGDCSVLALSGNPRAGSRTLGAAVAAAELIAGLIGTTRPVRAVDLSDHAGQVFAADRPDVDAALAVLAASTVAVIATPVYKASYTGLLKSFLDLYGSDALAGVAAVPLVVSAAAGHALVGDVHLRALLVELGAVVPARAITLVEAQLADVGPALETWRRRAAPAILRAIGIPAGAPQSVVGSIR